MDDNTDGVDQAAENNSPFAAHAVSDITGGDGTEEGTGREDRDDQRGVGGGDGLGLDAIGETLDGSLEDGRTEDSIDITRVISEEDTSERGKGADQVGLEGDGRLDALDVGVVGESNHFGGG